MGVSHVYVMGSNDPTHAVDVTDTIAAGVESLRAPRARFVGTSLVVRDSNARSETPSRPDETDVEASLRRSRPNSSLLPAGDRRTASDRLDTSEIQRLVIARAI